MVVERGLKPAQGAPFYHRKITRRGGTSSMSIGEILPKDWRLVRVRVVKMEGKTCNLEIVKLD